MIWLTYLFLKNFKGLQKTVILVYSFYFLFIFFPFYLFFFLLLNFHYFFYYFILFLNLKHCISFAKHQNESKLTLHEVVYPWRL